MKRCQFSIYPVLLAAGQSSRLGQPKQLIQLFGESLLTRQIKAFSDLSTQGLCERLHVVLGYEAARLTSAIPETCAKGINILHHTDWQQGMGTGIAAAVTQILPQAQKSKNKNQAIMISLVDQWGLSGDSYRQLIKAWQRTPQKIHASRSKGWSGPPAIFPQRFWPQLTQLQTSGAKHLLSQNSDLVAWHQLEGCELDLDNQQDLQRLRDFERRHDDNQAHG